MLVITNFLNLNSALNFQRTDKIENHAIWFSYPLIIDELTTTGSIYISPEQITYQNNTSLGLPLFSGILTLQYEGTLAEGYPANISAKGYLYPEGQQLISEVKFCFKGAERFNFLSLTTPFVRMELQDSNRWIFDSAQGTSFETITWSCAGIYTPYLVINFKNGTTSFIDIQDSLQAHVYGIDVIQQQDNNRKITALTVTATIIGLVTAGIGAGKYLYSKKIDKDTV